jgi:RND family efflux transporter MFP subunit
MTSKNNIPMADQWLRRLTSTAFVVLIASLMGRALWQEYMLSPWTRDGRIRAETVNIATEVSGKVTDLRVVENQFVHKNDILFIVDPEEYHLALAKAEATLESRRQDMVVREELSQRRSHLSSEAISKEEQQTSESTASMAAAAFREAKAQCDLVRLSLSRTTIRSPANGYITNLRLRTGDYAMVGQTKLTVIDSDSFWVSGYFEETKMPRIREGNTATMALMGVEPNLTGHVESISRGIADSNGTSDAQGLATVNPIFYWVRLAQRIPVRIHIDRVPDGVVLAAGMTCTVTVIPVPKK